MTGLSIWNKERYDVLISTACYSLCKYKLYGHIYFKNSSSISTPKDIKLIIKLVGYISWIHLLKF